MKSTRSTKKHQPQQRMKLVTGLSKLVQQVAHYPISHALPKKAQQPTHSCCSDPDRARAALYMYRAGCKKAACSEWEEALIAFENSLESFRCLYGELHNTVAKTLNKMGLVYVEINEPYYAYDSFTKALAIQEQILLPGDEELAETLQNIDNLLAVTRSEMEIKEAEYLECTTETRSEMEIKGGEDLECTPQVQAGEGARSQVQRKALSAAVETVGEASERRDSVDSKSFCADVKRKPKPKLDCLGSPKVKLRHEVARCA